MANNYTTFAEFIPMSAAAAMYAARLDALAGAMSDADYSNKEELRLLLQAEAEATIDDDLLSDIFAVIDVDDDDFYGSSCYFEPITVPGDPVGLYIKSDERAPIFETVAAILQATMRRFDLAEPICIQWADTCSKMRAGEFGGGAIVITQAETHWMTTQKFVSDTTEAIATRARLEAGFESA